MWFKKLQALPKGTMVRYNLYFYLLEYDYRLKLK